MFYDKTVLDNGITVVSEPMDGVRSVALGLWMRVGNRDENSKELGISHFMEHMLFKGTPTRTAADISKAFDAIGADLNAFTSREYTCFYARMIDEHLATGFEMLADMLVNASFSEETIEPEREVVIEEIARSEDQPEDQVYDLLAATMKPNDPLGLPVLGNRETVGSFTSADMHAYHDKNYVTGNLIVVACGSVDHAQLVELSERYLVDMIQGERRVRTPGVSQATKKLATITKKTEQAHIVMGYPSIKLSDERRTAHYMLDMALGGSMSSRLFQEIREQRGLVYTVYSSTQSYEDSGTMAMYAGTRPENVGEVLELASREFEKVRAEGITQEELERVCELACGSFVLGMESPRTHMIRLGRFLTCGVPVRSLSEVLERYRAVTIDEVNAAAERLFGSEPTIAVVSPLEESEIEALVP